MSNPATHPVHIQKVREATREEKIDLLAVEEPLEIRLGYGPEGDREQKSLAITMRTPGQDLELALGFLFTEDIIRSMDDVTYIRHCTDHRGEASENVVRVELHPNKKMDWSSLQRHFYTTSSCGICGKASIESLERICPARIVSDLCVASDVIHRLSEKMREAQNVFEYTGGLHASALFDAEGNLLYMREDIGRHNALDKLIGAALFKGLLPMDKHLVMLSGRSCYELVQKAVMAGIRVIAAVGAPSSLAVQLAVEHHVTLIGFLRNDRFNLYSGEHRVKVD